MLSPIVSPVLIELKSTLSVCGVTVLSPQPLIPVIIKAAKSGNKRFLITDLKRFIFSFSLF
jgi:hypothetical protein